MTSSIPQDEDERDRVKPMSNLPNALTIGRIALVPLFVAAFFLPVWWAPWAVFALFCLAGITDALDGLVARKLGAVSSFGRMLDPIADKLIVSAALLMLASDRTLQGIHLVPALVILCREILVSGLREFLAGADVSLPVTRVAKMKTVMQMVAIGALIASSASEHMLPGVTAGALIGLWAAAGLTLYTGNAYLQAGLVHARGVSVTRPKSAGATPRREQRTA
jgi:cardiolipin synthase